MECTDMWLEVSAPYPSPLEEVDQTHNRWAKIKLLKKYKIENYFKH